MLIYMMSYITFCGSKTTDKSEHLDCKGEKTQTTIEYRGDFTSAMCLWSYPLCQGFSYLNEFCCVTLC